MKSEDLQSALDRAFPEESIRASILPPSNINAGRVIVRVYQKGLKKALAFPLDETKVAEMTPADLDKLVAEIRNTFDAGPDAEAA